MANKKIDLRPHYPFAYCSEGMEFGCKHLLYYRRKEKAMHILYEAAEYVYIDSDAEDWELTIQIADEDAKLLEEVFGLFMESYQIFSRDEGNVWYICDGYVCTVICGKKRVHYDGPFGQEPFGSFGDLMNYIITLKDDDCQTDIQGIIKSAKVVKAQLEEYINHNK